MGDLRQRREPLRSRKYLDGSRGQPCTLEFVGICNHNAETTVACHIHDESFGGSMKADDVSTVDGCNSCHMFLDHGWVGKISQAVLLRHIIRAMQRTLRNRIERGIVFVQLDVAKPASERPVKPRKPKSERAKVSGGRPLQSATSWPPKGSRKIQSASNLSRKAAP